MKNFLTTVSFLLAFSSFVGADEVISYGIVDNTIVETESNNHLIAGERHIIASWNLVKETDQIPKKLGIEFGINYKLDSFVDKDSIAVAEVIVFPGNGLTNPETGKTTRVDTEVIKINPKEEQYFSYQLDYPWEAKSGVWIFQVKRDNVLLLEKKFYIK